MTEMRDTLLDIARAAHEAEKQAADAERDRQREQQRQRAEADDAKALAAVMESPLAQWFPGVAWEMVNRELPQRQVIVRDPQSGLHFKVHPSGDDWNIDLVTPNPRSRFGHDVNLAQVSSPAGVGRWLADREREKTAVTYGPAE